MRDIVDGILIFDSGALMTLTEAQLRRYVDERYVERGREYAKRGLIVLNNVTDTQAKAGCFGSRVYAVELNLKNNRLSGVCSCPAFEDFGPCKHIAATAFAVMSAEAGTYHPHPNAIERTEEHQQIRNRLLDLEKSELVDLLMNSLDDEELNYWLDQ